MQEGDEDGRSSQARAKFAPDPVTDVEGQKYHHHDRVSEGSGFAAKKRRGTGCPSAINARDLAHESAPPTENRRSSRSNGLSIHIPGISNLANRTGESRRRVSKVVRNAGGAVSIAAGHLRAKDIVHVNTGAFKLELAQRLIYGSPFLVITACLFLYVASVFIFAAIFYAFGEECYKYDPMTPFSFSTVLWISVHAFSTIGFGNVAPLQTCTGAQIVLLIESFVSVLIVSAIGGYVVKQFLKPISSVRFSTVVLVNGGRRRIQVDDEGDRNNSLREASGIYKFITFRMVRQGRVQLRDVRIHMQAQWWSAGTTAFGDRDHHKGRVASLALEQSYFTTLEQLQVWHRLDEASPLWRMRNNLEHALDGLEVSVSAFDMASLQQVQFYTRYEKSDVVLNAVFENTLSPSGSKGNKNQLQADHSKLDRFAPEEEDPNSRLMMKKKARRHDSILSGFRLGRSKSDEDARGDAAGSGPIKPLGRFVKRRVSDEDEKSMMGNPIKSACSGNGTRFQARSQTPAVV